MTKIQVDSNGKAIMLNNKALVASEGGITPTGTLSITSNGVYDVTNYASADVSVSGGGGSNWVITTNFSISLSKSYWQLQNIVDSVGYCIIGEDSDGYTRVVGCLYDVSGNVIRKSNGHYLALYQEESFYDGEAVYLTFCDADNGSHYTMVSIDLIGE